MVELCTISRRQGLVALSKLSFDNRFLKKACQLISDGTKEDLIRDTLQIEIEAMRQRHSIVQDVFKKMGSYAPAFGMIGTLIGLVQMLNGLDDPSSVGPSMAVALLTTFYGSVYAFMFMNPIAGKLQARTAIEIVNLEIMFEGAASIVQENNPMVVYEKLSSFIPTTLRKPMDEKRGKGK
jgi:chemotaxis protein MotA